MSAAAVILAAGAGRRLGGVAKALLRTPDGTSFLEAVWTAARAGGAGRALVVVAEPHRVETEAEARRLGLGVAVNPDPERGMASSVAVGFARAESDFGGSEVALLWPVDHPAVRPDTVRAVIETAAAGSIAVPTRGGRGGHPTGFPRAIWSELARCDRDPDGARGVVRTDPNRVVRFDVEDPGVTRDVDTEDDLP